MTTDHVVLNGRLMPADQARVSIFDLGFLRGVGAFETLRTYGGHPHALPAHLERLWTCAAELGIPQQFDEATVRSHIRAIATASGHEEMRLNMIVTPGPNTDGLFGAEDPTWVIAGRALQAPPAALYTTGVAAISFRGERHLPHLKTTNYLTAQSGSMLAKHHGAHEALYCDDQGLISEGLTSNVLLVEGKRLVDPAAPRLQGITLGLIQRCAGDLGLEWVRESVDTARLQRADEVLLTSSVREVLPVVQVDGQAIGAGHPGPIARQLLPAVRERATVEAAADAAAAS